MISYMDIIILLKENSVTYSGTDKAIILDPDNKIMQT